MLPLLLSLALSSPAHAEQNGLYMWGAGPTVSTIVFPGSIPASFPTHENAALSPRENMDKVKRDLGIAGRGVVYLKNKQRLGSRLNLGFGEDGYRAVQFFLEYEQSMIREENINVFVGGGVGLGKLSFNQGGDQGDLSMNTYLTRAQVSAIYRDKHGRKNAADDRAYELALFVNPLGWHGPETYRVNGTTVEDPESANPFAFLSADEDDDQELKRGLYNPTIGAEFTVFFGDFTPPDNNKRDNKRGKKGKGKKGKGKKGKKGGRR